MVTATEFDINKKNKIIFSSRSSPLCSNDLYALRSPLNICQMIRRNGDHKATKLFIGPRHFTARIQWFTYCSNVHDSLIVYTLFLSISISLKHLWTHPTLTWKKPKNFSSISWVSHIFINLLSKSKKFIFCSLLEVFYFYFLKIVTKCC